MSSHFRPASYLVIAADIVAKMIALPSPAAPATEVGILHWQPSEFGRGRGYFDNRRLASFDGSDNAGAGSLPCYRPGRRLHGPDDGLRFEGSGRLNTLIVPLFTRVSRFMWQARSCDVEVAA